MADAVAERRPVEQRGGQHVHGVEPAAGLPDVLDDEVARVVVLEPLAVLERVVHLGERHRAGLEPAVQHLRHPAHGRPPGRVVRVGPGQLVDVRPVQVGDLDPEVRAPAPRASRRRPPAGTAGRRTSTPGSASPRTGCGEIDQSRALASHLPNEPSLTCAGIQVICWLSSTIRSRNVRDRDEPRRHRLVDQRRVAAPAVRVRVRVACRGARTTPRSLRSRGDRLVGLEDLQALDTAGPAR